MAIHWSTPVWLWPLLLIVATGAVLWTLRAYRQTRPQVSGRLTRVLSGLRTAAFLLLVLALAGPVLSRLRVTVRPAEVAVVLEDSGSMGIRDAGGDTLQDRWSAALAVAATLDSALGQYETPVKVVVMRGNGLASLSEFRLGDRVVAAPGNHGTNLGNLRRQVADRLAGRPVRATVLISDGQETSGWQDTRRRQGGASASGGLFVVGVGDPDGPPDRLLKDLRYTDTAYLGDEVVVEFGVDHRYLAAGAQDGSVRRITARLTGPGGVVAEETVTSAAKLVPFSLSFKPEREGLQAYELSVGLMDNERFPANNKASLAISVRRERARVLLLSAMPSWDVRFLAQAAAQEQRIALTVVYPSARGLVFADSLTLWREPDQVDGWLAWDAVVLTGWAGPLAGLDWTLLAQAVNQGLGLLVTAGSSSGPGGGPMPAPPPPDLARMLPVRVDNWRWLPGPFFVAQPADAAGHPILGGVGRSSGERADGGGLAGLPPVAQVAAVRAVRGAEVLLTGRPQAGAGALSAGPPVLAVASREQGRTVWFGGRYLWELAFWERGGGAGEADTRGHAGRRLARNLLVWTAEGTTGSGLAFTGRQTFFQEGEPVRLRAQWRDMRGQPVVDRPLSVVLRGGQAAQDSLQERTFALRPAGAARGLSEVTLPPLAPGRYSVQLVGGGEPPVLGAREELIVANHNLELTQVRLDRRRLSQLAARGNGRYYAAADAADRRSLLDDLAALSWQGDRVEQRHRLDVRAGWPLLVIVVTLLGLEWYLRRRHGLL